MRKSAIKQIRLEARAKAFADAADLARHPMRLADSPQEALDRMASIAKENLANHIKEHGEYVGAEG